MPKYCFRYPIAAGVNAPDGIAGQREVLVHQDGSHYICRWTVTDPAVQAALTADPLVEMMSEANFEAMVGTNAYGAR